ncbi:uncharacterized protein LOC127012516 [Drosophila biarmipes]|uniref:uncharacterized protein LOC127012516 n=1 Tax=Drosophila biarmipes TaxID=125945 RepID=UPI0007E866A0|nr:uncharacterized protein LOC127012516 [Drosophila biarmipes]XP_050746560.1 uncharacterized protein LOC127012516 [Drosophila biarmipes]
MEAFNLVNSPNPDEPDQYGPNQMDVNEMLTAIFQKCTPLERPYLPRFPKHVLLPLWARPNFPKITLGPRARSALPPRGGLQMGRTEICHRVPNKIGNFPPGRVFAATVLHMSTLDSTLVVSEWDSTLVEFLFVGKIPLQELGQLPNYGELFAVYSAAEKSFSRIALYAGTDGAYEAYRVDYGTYIRMTGMERIFKLPEDLQKLPAEAIRCCLVNVNNAAQVPDCSSHGIKLEVLHNNGAELLVDHIKPEKASEESDGSEDSGVGASFEQSGAESRVLGSTARVQVSFVHSPIEFYAHFLEGPVPPAWKEEEVPKGTFTFRPLEVVLAKYEDGLYYRARIMSMVKCECLLFYVDFGYSQFALVDSLVPCFDVQKMNASLAVKFKLEGLQILEYPTEKGAEGIEYLTEKLVGQQIDVTITDYQPLEGYLIRLPEALSGVQEQLLAEGYAFPE